MGNGTGADFYSTLRSGDPPVWLGSIAYDGEPNWVLNHIFPCKTKNIFEIKLRHFLKTRDDSILVKEGWPWPWENSTNTEYTYLYDRGSIFYKNYNSRIYTSDTLAVITNRILWNFNNLPNHKVKKGLRIPNIIPTRRELNQDEQPN